MGTPLQIEQTIKEQISNQGETTKTVGNDDLVHWFIPGTNGLAVDLNFDLSNNPNNGVKIEILRGSSRVKTITDKIPFSRTVSLRPQSGMVNVKIYQTETGGWFGGFLEKTFPGAPGIAGRYDIKLSVSTDTSQGAPTTESGNQTDELSTTGILAALSGESGGNSTTLLIVAGLILAALAFK